MSKHVSPALVGAFVVSGIVLAVIAVLVFGSGRFFDQRRSFVSFFPGSVSGLAVGSNVSFRGVRVGTVTEVLISMNGSMSDAGEDMRIPVVYEIDETLIQERGAAISLDDDEQFAMLLSRGLSARLDTESLLTGRLYVSLDFRPDAEPTSSGRTADFPEIPTVRSPMAEMSDKLTDVADRLLEVDVESVLTALRSTLDGFEELVTNPELQSLPANVDGMTREVETTLEAIRDMVASTGSEVGPTAERLRLTAERAEATMESVDRTLGALEGVVDPRAPLLSGLVGTFQELERAARSLRRVAEMLEREPAVLLRGRDSGGGL